ncbi:unnamed protein product [Dovyalis caffra]|uniref:Uncharacterized protein n=1 Tax=Dovyalis caffra TaxID=77055 RepID=A0AAV1RQ61_9ROSI|nr:unnamed protein product [Dovyalis caffra]
MGEHTNLHLDPEQVQDRDQQEEEEEEEEALSLCDFPLEGRNKESPNIATHSSARSSSEPAEFFEFFSDLNSEMRSAEDIICRGKLVPFKEPYFTPQNQSKEDKQRISFRRRCESLSEFQSSVSRSNSTKNNISLMRNSRSLDYRKLERFSSSKKFSPEFDIERSSSLKSIHAKGEVKKTASKPRWYLLMFGVVKPPTEMDLSDIKSRQVRRNSSMTMFPHVDADGKKAPVNQNSISKGSCRLLRVLSCRDPASVSVATSFLVPQVGTERKEVNDDHETPAIGIIENIDIISDYT